MVAGVGGGGAASTLSSILLPRTITGAVARASEDTGNKEAVVDDEEPTTVAASAATGAAGRVDPNDGFDLTARGRNSSHSRPFRMTDSIGVFHINGPSPRCDDLFIRRIATFH